jgi:hypothetical protein
MKSRKFSESEKYRLRNIKITKEIELRIADKVIESLGKELVEEKHEKDLIGIFPGER